MFNMYSQSLQIFTHNFDFFTTFISEKETGWRKSGYLVIVN